MKRVWIKELRFFLSLFILAFVWKIVVLALSIPNYILPPPEEVVKAIWASPTYFLSNALSTLFIAVCALAASTLTALLAATVMHMVARFGVIFYPLLIGLQAVPMIALAPLIVLWFGPNLFARSIMGAIVAFPAILIAVVAGLNSSRNSDLIFASLLTASRWRIFRQIELPRSVPSIVTGVKVGSTLSVIGAIVAEYAGSDRGIGYVIMQASYRTDTSALIASVLISMLIGVGLYYFVDASATRALPEHLV